jgi:hypothetical protein
VSNTCDIAENDLLRAKRASAHSTAARGSRARDDSTLKKLIFIFIRVRELPVAGHGKQGHGLVRAGFLCAR